MDLAGMMNHYLHSRILEDLKSEKQAWDQVKTVDDWQRFRDPRREALRAALGKFPSRCALDTRVTSEFRGNGYRRQNLAYQSQPGIWVTANLYLPEQHHDPMPGILEAGDVAEVASVLAPHPLLLQGLVNGRDRLVPVADYKSQLAPVYAAYGRASSAELWIRPGENGSGFANWFLAHLSSGAGNSPSSSGAQ
jgi:hypothetical protein